MTTMADVDRLLREYLERFESGGSVDPSDLLDQLEGGDRARLSTLIEGYLEHGAPAQEWDPEAFEGSVAERAVARVAESWSEASGQLPRELVKLRNERRITRSELVRGLAEALGVAAKEPKVAFYYHRMEHGLLPARSVSERVFDALASLLGTSAESLRELGAATTPASGKASPGALYARTARPPPEEYATDQTAEAAAGGAPRAEPEEPDEVDLLFTGG
jgi:hypothetical protein